jgi:hypothetical protein
MAAVMQEREAAISVFSKSELNVPTIDVKGASTRGRHESINDGLVNMSTKF